MYIPWAGPTLRVLFKVQFYFILKDESLKQLIVECQGCIIYRGLIIITHNSSVRKMRLRLERIAQVQDTNPCLCHS